MDTLKESVNHSRLYHYTNAKYAYEIIEQDVLLAGGTFPFNSERGKCVCLSRSFSFVKDSINNDSVIFVLNRDLLKNDYKIIPVSDNKNMKFRAARFATGSKAEELIFSNITNLHKYIDKILVTDKIYDLYKRAGVDFDFIRISDYKINEDVNMDNDIKITSREKGLQILYWLEDKGIDANFSQWNENSYYFNFNDERDYNNALILLYEYCGKDSIRYDDYSRMEIELDVDKAYPRLKNNVNSKYMGESLNEDKEDAKFTVKLYTDTAKWNAEVVANLKLEKNKQALLAYKQVMNDVVLLPIQTLYDRKIIKQLQSTVKKMVEIKWNIGKVQYRIVCRREDSNLYLLVPFIKSNTDKDTDKAVATAVKRFRLIGEDVDSAKSLDLKLLNDLIDELIDEADINQDSSSDDSITEQLLESDNVEDDLEDIIRDTIEENKNSGSKISLFEITTEPENPTRAKDEEKMYVVDFDDMKTDFRKLTIYPYEETEDGANKPVASFMLSGGLNGSGNWTDYLDDLQKLFEKLKEATGLEPLVYEESTDIADDVWDAKVFMYDHSKDDEEDDSLNEGYVLESRGFKVGDLVRFKSIDKNYYNGVCLDLWEDGKQIGILNLTKWSVEDVGIADISHIKESNLNSEELKLYQQKVKEIIAKRIKQISNENPLDEGLFNPDKVKKSYIQKEENDTYSLHSLVKWDNDDEIYVFNGNYPSLEDLYSSKPWTRGLEVKEELNEEVVYQTAPEELQDEFEKGMEDLGWSFDNNTRTGRSKTEYTPWDAELVNNAKNIHYQYISNNAFENDDDLDSFMDATFNLIDDIEDKYNCRFLYSGGLITDGEFKNHESLALDLKPIMYRTDEGPSPKYPGQSLKLNKGKPVRDSDKALIKDISNRMHMTDDEILNNVSDAKNEEYDPDKDGWNYEDMKHIPTRDVDLDETYSKKELHDFRNKVFNQQKIMTIYRKKRYGKKRLFCRTRCVNCGRQKRLFLSNLVTNPEKYGSCVCSDKNINARMDTIKNLYKGKKLLKSNTSGYTGVYWVAKYRGEPYNKWRAYIEIDGHRSYLGDFSSKSKAIRARRAAAKKGLDWYNTNKNEFMATSRRKRKRHRKYKVKNSTANS